jgi:hypothetical protein
MKKLLIVLMMIFSASTYAGQWSASTFVKKIYPHATNNTDGTIYLTFDVMLNPDNCTRDSLLALKKSNKLSSEIYSLFLAAANSGKKVSYWVGGCDDAGYPVLHHATQTF